MSDNATKLQRLADVLVEDILTASDEEILAEEVEDYGEEGARRRADEAREWVRAVLDKHCGPDPSPFEAAYAVRRAEHDRRGLLMTQCRKEEDGNGNTDGK